MPDRSNLNVITSPVKLIAFPVSHYCEKVRWALNLLEISYIEKRHLPTFHWKYTESLGGRSVPVLIMGDRILTDSAEILFYLHENFDLEQKIYPKSPQLKQEIAVLEKKFNLILGPCVRNWAYFYFLNYPKIMARLWGEKTPIWEQILFPFVFPRIRKSCQEGYKISGDSAAKSFKKIQEIFQLVSDRLSSGQKYLVGEDFTAADITFASLAAPAVLATGYTVQLPSIEDLPSKMVEEIKFLQQNPAGQYVERLYREKRFKNS